MITNSGAACRQLILTKFILKSQVQNISGETSLVVQNSDVRFGSLAALFTNISLMSAFPESGRSDRQKLGEIRVRFRPEADGACPER